LPELLLGSDLGSACKRKIGFVLQTELNYITTRLGLVQLGRDFSGRIQPAFVTRPNSERTDSAERQAAIESLMLVAKLGEPTMIARIGVMMTIKSQHRAGP
jgi:hypothetical protein